ncbi:MAG: 23S rRNA (guanosine(2251)-2'-O)-methyltransferase RlmB [Spirochaetes bacterium]|nr:23S rRNA (guanosine(2251)-2'-O)-methyltransferase RlmB [Spirochaetota bacterium]
MYRYVISLHSIEAYLDHPTRGMMLYLNRKTPRIQALEAKARNQGVPIQWLEAEVPFQFPGVEHSKGAILKIPVEEGKTPTLQELVANASEYSCLIMLDGITDVQNLGAILRSADLFGVNGVLIPKRRSAHESIGVDRTSAGASAYVPLLEVPNLVRTLSYLKEAGYWIYGADMQGKPAIDVDFNRKTVLVMGSEDKGLSRLVREACDFLVKIPMGGHVGSFNVSVATGILLYEIRRQQGFSGLDGMGE